MAEANPGSEEAKHMTEEASSGSWWGWIQAAKEKSVEVLDFVKKDLDEFTQAVQSEASSIVNSTTAVFKEKLKIDENNGAAAVVKKSVSSFLNTVSDVFYIPPEDEEGEAIVVKGNEPIVLDRFQAHLFALASDPKTFLTEPQDPGFAEWTAKLNPERKEAEIELFLATNDKLQVMHDQLVPDQLSSEVFWDRYLFQVHLARQEEAQRQQLRQRAEEQTRVEANDINWDEEENFGPHVDIPEDVQEKLLKEYEKECEELSLSKSSSSNSLRNKQSPSKSNLSSPVAATKEKIRTEEDGDLVVVSKATSSEAVSSGESANADSEFDDWDRPAEKPEVAAPSESPKRQKARK